MGGIARRVGWAAGFCGLVALMTAAGGLTVPAASATTSPGWVPSTAPVSGLSPSAGTAYGDDAVLSDVACPAAGSCVAVGNYQDSQGYVHGLIETQSGSAWQAATAPLTGLNPAPAADPEAGLTALACPESGTCAAIGWYKDAAGGHDGLIEMLSDGVWMAETAPSPEGSSTSSLQSISCPSASWCVSVGSYGSTSGGGGLIDTLSNGTWTASSLPDSGLPVAVNTVPDLPSVSCPAVDSCVVVGSFSDSQDNLATMPLLATLDAGTWSSAQAPLSQLEPQARSAELTEVSCTSDGFCAAVGSYDDTSNNTDALLATRSAGSWSVLAAPQTGLSPARGAGNPMDVNRVQCPAAGSCVAVGEYGPGTGIEYGLAEVLSNGSWSASTLPVTGLNPAVSNTLPDQSMTGISCVAGPWCVAIGTYHDDASGSGSGFEHGLLETLSNGGWTATTAPTFGLDPAAVTPTGGVSAVPVSPNAIACVSAVYCVSAGDYEDTSNLLRGLTETFSEVTAPPAVVVGAEGGDGALWVQAPQLGSGWHSLGGKIIAAPAVAAVPNPDTVQPLFITTGTNHELYNRSLTVGWRELGPLTVTCLDGPAAVITGVTLTVACRGTDNALWVNTATLGASGLPYFDQGWTSLGGVLSAGPAAAPVGGVMTFFVRGTNGRIYTRTLTAGYRVMPWACIGHPAAALQATGGVTVFACQGTDHALWEASTAGAGWAPAVSLGGALIEGPGVAAASQVPEFLAESTNKAVWARTTVSGWHSLGGVVIGGVGAAALN